MSSAQAARLLSTDATARPRNVNWKIEPLNCDSETQATETLIGTIANDDWTVAQFLIAPANCERAMFFYLAM